jgi:hypothetical protein
MHKKISLITPNFNGAEHLEKTILSVLAQGYPNLDYIIVDGGSTDRSLEIIERYRDRISHVISEPDEGNTDALNKGFNLATGEILGWINSDDLLFPGSLELLNEVFSRYSDVDWVVGRSVGMIESGLILTMRQARPWSWLRFVGNDFRHIPQESSFWRRSLWHKCGSRLDQSYSIASDFELWTRFFVHTAPFTLDGLLGAFRFRTGGQLSRTAGNSGTNDQYDELCAKALTVLRHRVPAAAWQAVLSYLPVGMPLQESFSFEKVDPLLAALDPPCLSPSWNERAYVKAGRDAPTLSISMSTNSTSRSLRFCGEDPFVWDSGPDLVKERITSVELDLTTEIEGAVSRFDDTSPPMPMLAGPLAIYDMGDAGLSVQLQFGEERFIYRIPRSSPVRVKVAIQGNHHIVLNNGTIIGQATSTSRQTRSALPHVVVGGGYLHRHWHGRIHRLLITTAVDDSIPLQPGATAHELVDVDSTKPVMPAPSIHLAGEKGLTLSRFKNKHQYERCFVMGNGPSLNKMNLNKLRGEVVFACNAAFLLFDRIEWRPKYYTCVDSRVIRDRAEDINRMLTQFPDMQAFFPREIVLHDGTGQRFDCRSIITPRPNVHYFNEIQNSLKAVPESMFSLDVERYVVQPYTVAITMLQLAAFLGFSPMYLIGCDTSYKISENVKQEGPSINGTGLLLTSTKDDDSNHFDNRYFGAGREWHNPQVEGMMMHHGWARTALEGSGRRVFNATVGGNLEAYKRVAYDSLF